MFMYGRKFKLTQELMDVIASYMNDEIREDLHSKMAPCEPERFLKEYAKRDNIAYKLEVSLGESLTDTPTTQLNELINKADKELYKNKKHLR